MHPQDLLKPDLLSEIIVFAVALAAATILLAAAVLVLSASSM